MLCLSEDAIRIASSRVEYIREVGSPNSGASAMSGIASTSEVNSEEVYCENSRLVLCRVRHPMGAVSDDQNMVTRTKCYLLRDAAGDSRAAAT
jgi:hypothetical protein